MKKIVFDIETKNIFQEVGKNDPLLLDISVVCIYDYETDQYMSFFESELKKLWPILEKANVLIGFNSDYFDIPILNKYYPGDLTQIKSLDIMKEIRNSLGRRIGLGAIAEATINKGKSGNGLEAVTWWKNGEYDKVKKYCIDDVKVTKEVYEYALKNKKLKYKDGGILKDIPLDTTDWEKTEEIAMTQSLPF
ncbi:MAG: ribonuclease H-like domain-containing protein [Candidatus Paceibacterota bacterium]